jgi:outer membrane protein assembly factor BamB
VLWLLVLESFAGEFELPAPPCDLAVANGVVSAPFVAPGASEWDVLVSTGPAGPFTVRSVPVGADGATFAVRAPAGTTRLPGVVWVGGLGSDARGAVVWGSIIAGEEPEAAAWVRAIGRTRWARTDPETPLGSGPGAVSAAGVVLFEATLDPASGLERATLVALDRTTGQTRWRTSAPLPAQGLARGTGVFDDGARWHVVGWTMNSASGTPTSLFWWQVARDGASVSFTASPPVLVKLTDAARSEDGAVWLAGERTDAPPRTGVVGRWTADELVWRAVPGCRVADHLAVADDRLWLGGATTQDTGWVADWPRAEFGGWPDPSTCGAAAPPR